MEVRELVAGSFLERAPLVTVSARTGEGLDELRQALRDRGLGGEGPVRQRTRAPADRPRLLGPRVRHRGDRDPGVRPDPRRRSPDGPAVRSGRTPGVACAACRCTAAAKRRRSPASVRPSTWRISKSAISRAARSSSRRARSRARRSPTPASSCFPAPVHCVTARASASTRARPKSSGGWQWSARHRAAAAPAIAPGTRGFVRLQARAPGGPRPGTTGTSSAPTRRRRRSPEAKFSIRRRRARRFEQRPRWSARASWPRAVTAMSRRSHE